MGIVERVSGAFQSQSGEGPGFVLAHGPKQWPIQQRPLQLGRLPECDVVVLGDGVSRIHAWIVPTREGPVLVDRGRHGTLINGNIVRAPSLLASGDEIAIGPATYTVLTVPRAVLEPTLMWSGSRIRRWICRYGLSEVLGTVAAVAAAVTVQGLTGNIIAGAYGGTLAEATVFYGIMLLRESVREAHLAGAQGQPFDGSAQWLVVRSLLLEFGVAELLDLLVIRPVLMAAGLRWLGGKTGALAGKLAADVVFYGPVLSIYEWRLARGADRPRDRARRTTATDLERKE